MKNLPYRTILVFVVIYKALTIEAVANEQTYVAIDCVADGVMERSGIVLAYSKFELDSVKEESLSRWEKKVVEVIDDSNMPFENLLTGDTSDQRGARLSLAAQDTALLRITCADVTEPKLISHARLGVSQFASIFQYKCKDADTPGGLAIPFLLEQNQFKYAPELSGGLDMQLLTWAFKNGNSEPVESPIEGVRVSLPPSREVELVMRVSDRDNVSPEIDRIATEFESFWTGVLRDSTEDNLQLEALLSRYAKSERVRESIRVSSIGEWLEVMKFSGEVELVANFGNVLVFFSQRYCTDFASGTGASLVEVYRSADGWKIINYKNSHPLRNVLLDESVRQQLCSKCLE